MSPVFTVTVAVLFLGETVHGYHLIGGGIALFGVLLAQYLKRPPGRREAVAWIDEGWCGRHGFYRLNRTAGYKV